MPEDLDDEVLSAEIEAMPEEEEIDMYAEPTEEGGESKGKGKGEGEGGEEGLEEIDMYAGAEPQDPPSPPPPSTPTDGVEAGPRRRQHQHQHNHHHHHHDETRQHHGPLIIRTPPVDVPTPPPYKYQTKASMRREQIEALEEIWYPFDHPQTEVRRPASLRSQLTSSRDDVTIVTQCSVDRLGRLEAMCRSWAGPISCAVHVPPGHDKSRVVELLLALHRRVETRGTCALSLTLLSEDLAGWSSHVINEYPINALRNAAVETATTSHLLLLDVDFVTPPGMHARLAMAVRAGLVGEQDALVVPAFELEVEHEVPTDRAGLAALVTDGNAEGFHVTRYPKGHKGERQIEKIFGAYSLAALRYTRCLITHLSPSLPLPPTPPHTSTQLQPPTSSAG